MSPLIRRPGSWRPLAQGFAATALSAICAAGPTEGHAAQLPSTGAISVTILDQTGAAIPEASVTIIRRDDPSATARPVQTTSPGIVTARGLPAGRYTVVIEAPGFESATLTLRAYDGDETRRTIRLSLERVSETVVVEHDRQREALDPRGFSTFLSRDQIDALPDDPESFARALQALAPPGAVIRIDGFTGGSLPPKSQILSIRIPRFDTFAAQDHGGLSGLSFIDLVTRPGGGRLQGSADTAFRDDALNARSPLSGEKAQESLRAATVAVDGPVVRDLMSFSASARVVALREGATVHALRPDGSLVDQPIVRPQDVFTVSGRMAASIGDGHTLRISGSSERRRARNLGVGDINLPERAYHSESSDVSVRLAAGGALGRHGLLDVRTQIRQSGSRTRSATEAPAVHVLDAFAAGGAQLAGGSRAVEIEAAADVDYAWRSHAARFGVLVEHGRFQSERASNYLGTYTFATLADYAARQPAFFTRRVGNPEVSYTNTQAGVYVQDDIRVARSVLLSVGLRIEAQTLTGSAPALLPRGGIAWSPFRAGTTTVRAGLGAFADWLPSSVYEHSLVVDGVRQHDVRVTFPTYPAPPATNELFAPRERYAIGDDLRMQRSGGLSVGIEHQATPGVRLSASYGLRLGYSLLRGLNLNAPIEGRRPDPLFGNVIETRSDAASRSNTVTVQAVAVDPRRRVELTGIYAFTSSRTNTMGPFAPPSDGRIDNDWGTSSPAHIATGMLTARIAKRLTISLLPRWRSGSPYTVTTGRDDNHDGLFTDRPSGVERNAGRTPPQLEVGARLAYTVPFGTPEAPALPSAGGDPDSLRAGSVVRGGGDGREAGKRRLELFASAENVTNHPNYAMVSGVMSSPFFGQPTAATRARTIEFGVRFGF